MIDEGLSMKYFRLLNTEVGNKYKQMMKYALIKIEQIHTIVLN